MFDILNMSMAHYLLYKIHVGVRAFCLKGDYAQKNSKKGDLYMAILKDKKAIIIGDRDGIPGQAISECAVSAGAEVVFSSTECFV